MFFIMTHFKKVAILFSKLLESKETLMIIKLRGGTTMHNEKGSRKVS